MTAMALVVVDMVAVVVAVVDVGVAAAAVEVEEAVPTSHFQMKRLSRHT